MLWDRYMLSNPIPILPTKRRWILVLTPPSGSGKGITVPSSGVYSVAKGSGFTVRAYPTKNSKFDHWILDGKPAGNNSTITVRE